MVRISRPWWRVRPGRGEIVVGAVLLGMSYAAAAAYSLQVPRTACGWVVGVQAGALVAAAFWLFVGAIVPARQDEGGTLARIAFYMAPFFLVQYAIYRWLEAVYLHGNTTFAAGTTAGAGALLYRRWSAHRGLPKGAPLPPPSHSSPVSHYLELLGLPLAVAMAVIALRWGDQLSTALEPVFVKLTGPLPGGHLAVAGHPILAEAALYLVELVFAFLVTDASLYALVDGVRDWGMPRAGAYICACLPFVIALGWSVRQPGLVTGCLTSLAGADRVLEIHHGRPAGSAQQGRSRATGVASETSPADGSGEDGRGGRPWRRG